MPNKHVNLTAEKRCFSVPSVLRTPAAGYVRRWAPARASRRCLPIGAMLWQSTAYRPPMERAMASSIEVLEAEALQLPAADRARLVERLIASLDIDPAIEEAWAAEVERRNAEIESGAVSLIPGPEALAELKAQFR